MKKRSITILYNSPVILTFALLSLLALGLGKLTNGWTTQNLFCVYRSPLTDWLTYPRFFLHLHVLFEIFPCRFKRLCAFHFRGDGDLPVICG